MLNPTTTYQKIKSKIKKKFSKQLIYPSVSVGSGDKKIIYHVGAWEGNWGDAVLQAAIMQELAAQSSHKLTFIPVNAQKSIFDSKFIDKINNTANLLLLGGGGLIFHREEDKSESGWQFNIKIENIDKIQVPLVVYAVGFNKFRFDSNDFPKITNSHLKKIQEKSKLFSVRDIGTKRELVKRGLDKSKIEVIADPAMFLNPKSTKLPLIDKSRMKIGVNLALDRFWLRFPSPSRENLKKFLTVFANGMSLVVKKYNAQIIYIGHIGISMEEEGIGILKEVIGENIHVLEELDPSFVNHTVEKAGYFVDIYRQMDLIFGMRGHANIIPFGVGVPFIAPVSHNKNLYFLEEIKMPWLAINIDRNFTAESVVKKTEDLLSRKKEYEKARLVAFNIFKKRNNQFNKEILKIIE